uniref:Chalcone-flavonone isomerase family protein n=1 Tax=Lomagramma matthewii TaxID=449116 RepID=A0A4Y6HR06_9MONI|nr:chalcone isomerase 1 [Lomagramma matthewii]
MPVVLSAQQDKEFKFDGLNIEGISFESSVRALASTKMLVLGGAGDRGLEKNGKFIKFTTIGIYVDDAIIPDLSRKLGGKTVDELCDKELLFEEVVAAPFEKLLLIYFLLPLTGPEYAEKVFERIDVQGIYKDLKEESKQNFEGIFAAEHFPPGSCLVLSFSAEGLKVAFTKVGEKMPEKPVAVVEDRRFADAYLTTIICKDGVSPSAKLSLAERLSKYF